MEKNSQMNRRHFMSTVAKSSMAIPLVSIFGPSILNASNTKKRLAMIGTGSRGLNMWGKSLLEDFGDSLEFIGLCDINPKRVEFAKKHMGIKVPTFIADDFKRMIEKTEPDTVIVTTVDCFHAQYAVAAMEMGCNVICEKPIATTANQCRQIIDAEYRTGKKVNTTFNVRYFNGMEQIKKIIMSGELGNIISMEYQENLDTSHGAQYYRRWHGKKRFSGSLLVHKASHHFDVLNWFVDSEPEEVHAFGAVAFYGKNNSFRSEKCRTCPFKTKCKFYWDITNKPFLMDLYVNCESEDGYIRDSCVWDNEIDSYDTATVNVKYKNGVLMSYTLNAFMPIEGHKAVINCEYGKIEQPVGWEQNTIQVAKSFGETKKWDYEVGTGGHGGADIKLKNHLFNKNQADPLNQRADSRAGVLSSMIGIAAVKSIETGKPVKIKDLIDFPLEWKW